MSSSVVGTVALGAVVVGVGTGVLAAAAVAKGTALALERMQADFAAAQAEFEARQTRLREETEALRAAHALRRTVAAAKGALVDAGGVAEGTAGFLARAVEDLVARAEAQGASEAAAARALRERAAWGETAILPELDALMDRLDASPVRTDDDWSLLLQAVRRDLESPLFNATLRLELAREVDALDRLPRGERAVAKQGLDMVRARVRREAKARLVALDARAERAERFRRLAGEAMGHFRAVAGVRELPQFGERARKGLVELRDALADEEPEAHLRRVALDAKALYDEAQEALLALDQTTAVCEKIGDVLANLGYRVSSLDPAEGLGRHVALDGDRGLSIAVDPKGRVHAEMVAYDASGAEPSPEDEEAVCRLVDELFAALRQSDVPIKERTRKRRKKEERLRVVLRPAAPAVEAARMAEPKERHVEP